MPLSRPHARAEPREGLRSLAVPLRPTHLRTAPGPGAILQLVRSEEGLTRTELMQRTGVSRATMAQRLDLLLESGLIYGAEGASSVRGRPPTSFAFNGDCGVVLSAGLGATHCRLGLVDLSGRVLAETSADHPIADPPEDVIRWVHAQFDALLSEHAGQRRLYAIGIGIPAPVEHRSGTPVRPPLMPGWDAFPLSRALAAPFGVPVLVDNDVNTMAWGEHCVHWRETPEMLFLKVGWGIGLGIVSDGRIQRGADGAAGDIGHLPISDPQSVLCHCGNTGCLEAVAGGGAMARQLTEKGLPAKGSRDVVRLAEGGNVEAMALIRQSGRYIGEALVSAVNLLNPRSIVVGGDMAHADHLLLAGIREAVYQRSPPLATRHLRIARSELDDRAGLIGGAMMAIEHVLDPGVIDQTIARSNSEHAAPASIA
jgi:predicted NBD/HSP70 family sugar kinase